MEEVKIEKIVVELISLRIPEFKIRMALGLPLKAQSQAKTVSAAKKEHEDAPIGSEKQTVAFIKWNQLSLGEVENAVTAPEVEEAFFRSPAKSEARTASFIKWIGLLETVNAVKEVFDYITDDTAEAKAIRRIYELLMHKTSEEGGEFKE